ncbi:MAG: nuclease/transposase family protein, partial [Acidimicrobiales bacterium]
MGRYETTGTRKRTREKGAPTHVATVPLDPSPAELALALTRNRAGLRLYNAALTEAKKRSKAAEATKEKIAETYRTMAEGRDRDHGNLVNRLYALGDDLRCEGLDYRSWQKHWPHSIRDRAPGAFVERARRRGKAVRKPLYEYDSRLALSQTCIGGERKKKPLSERRHVCEIHGLDVDRDLFSAFLGLHVERAGDGDVLDLVGARSALSERTSAIG